MTYEDCRDLLARIGAKYGFDPEFPIEAEAWWRLQLAGYAGPPEEVRPWLDQLAARHFRSLHRRPQWLQGEDWAFINGNPAVFVGQLDVPGRLTGFRHDEVFFVFWDPDTGETEVVRQAD